MRIDSAAVVASVQRVCFLKHLIDEYHDGHYTLGEMIRYGRTLSDTGWEIECIPKTPRALQSVLEHAEDVEREYTQICSTHTCSEYEDFGDCVVCGAYRKEGG